MKRGIKIVATGEYLPKRVVTGHEIDQILGLKLGGSEAMSGVAERRYITDETASFMGASALRHALENSNLKFEDLDAIICASGTQEQPLPCTAALIQRQFGNPDHPVPSFDINSTCLSFVTAFDLASSLIETKRYRRIAIVSAEIASVGLNPAQHEAYTLFGDGAAAVIVERPQAHETSGVLHAAMVTHSQGADHCKIEGGGTKHHARGHQENDPRYLFSMEGRKVFKLVLETIGDFFDESLKEAELSLNDVDVFIPHQASKSGMELVRKKLGIHPDKYVNILSKHGNMIAASIPLALHRVIQEGKAKRGDKIMLAGTSAGMSIGYVFFEY